MSNKHSVRGDGTADDEGSVMRRVGEWVSGRVAGSSRRSRLSQRRRRKRSRNKATERSTLQQGRNKDNEASNAQRPEAKERARRQDGEREGSPQQLSLLQHSQGGTRKKARRSQKQGPGGAGWLGGFYLWRRCSLKPPSGAGPIGCRRATRAIRPAPPPSRLEGSIAGESPPRRRVHFLPSFLLRLLLRFLPGRGKTRGDVRLQLDLAWTPTAARHSSRRLPWLQFMTPCHVPIGGHTLCTLFVFTSHPAHRRRFVSLFRIPLWMGMACLSWRAL
jgi:hypothetical protein